MYSNEKPPRIPFSPLYLEVAPPMNFIDLTKPDISLTKDEVCLLRQLDLNSYSPHQDNHAQFSKNEHPIVELMHSLLTRQGIPDRRLRLFCQPECRMGSGKKSYLQTFEGNGTSGDEIFSHPHFLRFFTFFLYGPNLPTHTIREFKEHCEGLGTITSGDYAGMEKCARKLVRATLRDIGMSYRQAIQEEFFSLCLDMNFAPSQAKYIRKAVMKIRS